jgi:hypothetical protein
VLTSDDLPTFGRPMTARCTTPGWHRRRRRHGRALAQRLQQLGDARGRARPRPAPARRTRAVEIGERALLPAGVDLIGGEDHRDGRCAAARARSRRRAP